MNILITGGSSGLGEAITKKLAADENNTIYFTYNRSIANVQKLETDFPNVKSIKCDFTKAADVHILSNQIAELDLDILINNAYVGDPIKTYFHKIAIDDFSNDFNNSILPVITLTQAAITGFRKKKQGKIITVLTSILLNAPPIGASIYVANKAYLESLVKSWASENMKFNITSNSVSPAFMLTNFTKDTDERIIEQLTHEHPLKKLLTVEEVAETIFFLTKATPQINGMDIVINSGVNIK